MNPQQENELLSKSFRNNVDAIACAKYIINASQVLDDLWDKDKEVSGSQAVTMVIHLTVDLARNPFYLRHQVAMVSIIERAIMQWMEANDIEKDAHKDELRVSYVIRSSITDAIIQMVYLLGDRNHARAAAREIRRMVYLDNESFDDYVNEHSSEV